MPADKIYYVIEEEGAPVMRSHPRFSHTPGDVLTPEAAWREFFIGLKAQKAYMETRLEEIEWLLQKEHLYRSEA